MCHGSEVLAVDGMSVSFPGHSVLHDVVFTLEAGQFCGLIGANGSGKTTLLRTILGFQMPSAGTIRMNGAKGRASVGYVPQKIMLDPYLPLRARDLVSLGLDGHRLGLPLPSKKRWLAVDEMLQAVEHAGTALAVPLQESFATYGNMLFEREVNGKDFFDWGRRGAQHPIAPR